MKRAIGLGLLIIACILGFLTIKGTLPFMPILGKSMEPTLNSGSLLTIKPINPSDIKVGDIIIYNVPSMVREYYNYPPVVSHRVIEIKTVPSLSFRTKGDNTGEDPFTVRPIDIRGTVGSQIPYLGLPLLFFQSQQGLIFIIVALVLLTIFLYGGELIRGGTLVHRSIFAPVINEEKRANRVLTRKIEATEKKMDTNEQAMDRFATAISEYAQHLASHTSAVQGLAEASQELKRGAAEQNKVLMSLVQNVSKTPPSQDITTPRIEPPAPVKPQPQSKKNIWEIKPEKPQPQPQKNIWEIKTELPPRFQKMFEDNFKPFHRVLNIPVTPGCARKQPEPAKEAPTSGEETAFDRFQNRQELTEEALKAQKKISKAINRLHRELDTMNGQE